MKNMKKNSLLYILAGSIVTLASCADFLDTMPDNRAEVNTESKITNLLVSAYPSKTDVAGLVCRPGRHRLR